MVANPFGPPHASGMKCGGIPPIFSVAASAPVSTHKTPGAILAAVTSIDFILA